MQLSFTPVSKIIQLDTVFLQQIEFFHALINLPKLCKLCKLYVFVLQ